MHDLGDWLTLRSTDLDSAMRLVAELGEFAPGSSAQRRHFLSRVAALVGAPVSIWLELCAVPPDGVMITRADDQGWSDDSGRASLCEYLAAQAEVEDPTIAPMQAALHFGEAVARGRRELVADNVWYRSMHFQKYRRTAGLDDCIYSTFFGGTGFQTFSLHRPLNEKPFTDADRALVGAIHNGCVRLLDDTELRIVESLSPRLRQTMQGLMRGLSDKEVASELDLSPHTLHGYKKTLYRRLGVSSRLELATRFARLFQGQSGARAT